MQLDAGLRDPAQLDAGLRDPASHAVEERLHAMGRLTYVFDGDNVLQGVCRDSSFSPYHDEDGLKICGGYSPLFTSHVLSGKGPE